jgi:peptidoglycan/LPS O-acetylase OafA/YrhL
MSHAFQPAAERFHALDAVRAGALLLGVAVHASLSFFPTQIWPIGDSHRSTEILVGFLTSHIFRMSLFFVIAGFFAHMLLHKRGVKGFIKDRLKRIGLPLVVFWPPLFVAFMAVIIWSAVKASGGEMPEPPEGSLTWRTAPLLHTWFLYVLLWFYAGALALFGLSRLIDRKGNIGKALDGAVRVLAKTHLLPFVLGAPLAAVFFFHESWVAWAGVRTPDTGLAPNIPAMVAFGTAFAFGWLLHRQPQLLSIWRRWWPIYLAAAVALTIVCVRIVLTGAPLGNASGQSAAGADLLTAIVHPLAIWAWCFGLTGAAMRFLSGENKVVRYLADSSYWLYLIHLPIVMVGQVLVAQWDVSAYVKFPLIVAGSVALMLATYQLLVRGTFIGGWLNGRRYGRKADARRLVAAAVSAE